MSTNTPEPEKPPLLPGDNITADTMVRVGDLTWKILRPQEGALGEWVVVCSIVIRKEGHRDTYVNRSMMIFPDARSAMGAYDAFRQGFLLQKVMRKSVENLQISPLNPPTE